jgi:ADP-L-glycero-D-manno-heptose 6-epimerase
MHFIVTGGAGFIGSNLVAALALQDPQAEIVVVDDFSSASYHNLVPFAGDVLAASCEELDWTRAFGGTKIDCLFHLASITDTTFYNERDMIYRNVEGLRNVLRFALPRGIRVVYASSAATYGKAQGLTREDYPPRPVNVYGFSKMVLDNLARQAWAEAAQPVVGLRYYNVYGPREAHKDPMASMIYQLWRQMKGGQRPRVFKHGQQRRDFVYVKDAVTGTLLAGRARKHGIYNIGSGEAASFNEVIAHLNAALGSSLEAEYIDNPYEAQYQNYTQADLSRAEAELGYAPRWAPARGIADYVAWLEGTAASAGPD